ncbi:MAG: hypothetical protein ACK4N5_21560, partial [Myxococcales bacterium]
MNRNVWLGLFAAATISACSCNSEPNVAFVVEPVAPLDGTTLRAADDVDPATPGLQVDVVFRAVNFTPQAAELQVDGKATGDAATFTGAMITFKAVSLESGPRVLTLRSSGSNSDGASGDSSVSLQLNVDFAPVTPALAITGPAAGVLNATADLDPLTPRLQVNVGVRSDGGRSGTLTLCSTSAAETGAPACARAPGRKLAERQIGGRGAFELPVTLPEGRVDLTVELADVFSGEVFTSETVTYDVDTLAPALEFLAPTPNETVVRNPFPVLLKTDAEAGQVVTVEGGLKPVSGPVGASGEVTLEIEAAEGAVELIGRVSDRAGNPSARTGVIFQLDTEPCQLVLVQPATATPFFNGGDDL